MGEPVQSALPHQASRERPAVRVSRARPLQISSPAQTPSTRRSRSFTADAPSEMPDAVGLAPSGVRPCGVAPGWVAVERGGGGADEFQGGCASRWPSASASGGRPYPPATPPPPRPPWRCGGRRRWGPPCAQVRPSAGPASSRHRGAAGAGNGGHAVGGAATEAGGARTNKN